MELLSLCNPLLLGPPVLEPDLDLGVAQLELLGELCPLGDGEVALGFVLGLQQLQLLAGERSPGLPVRPVFPQDWPHWKDWRRLLVAPEVPQQHQLGLAGEEGREGGRRREERGRGDAVGPHCVGRITGGGAGDLRLGLGLTEALLFSLDQFEVFGSTLRGEDEVYAEGKF